MDRPALSLILPARNEAAIIRRTVAEVSAYLQVIEPDHEILVGDSGSTDGTGDVVRSAGFSRVRVVRVAEPGKGRILTRCLAEARGGVVGFLDADLEIPVEVVGRLLERIASGADAAIAVKVPSGTGRPASRRLGTRAFNFVVRRLFGSHLADHQAGGKLFRAHVVRPHLRMQQSTGWLWDTEMLVRLLRAGVRVDEVEFVPERVPRPSRVQLGDPILALVQLARLRLHLGWSTPPMPAPWPDRDAHQPEVHGTHA